MKTIAIILALNSFWPLWPQDGVTMVTHRQFENKNRTSSEMLNLENPDYFKLDTGAIAEYELDKSVKNEIWQKEEAYWEYVKNYDLENYLKLWDDQFVGYPSTNIVGDKAHITDWLIQTHREKIGDYDYSLTRKVENIFGDIAIVFYDVTQTWTNSKSKVVKSNTLKIIHTWRKSGDDWTIIGGMGAVK